MWRKTLIIYSYKMLIGNDMVWVVEYFLWMILCGNIFYRSSIIYINDRDLGVYYIKEVRR